MKISEFFEYNNQQVLEENENILEYLEQIFGKATEIDREGKKEFTFGKVIGLVTDSFLDEKTKRQKVSMLLCDTNYLQEILSLAKRFPGQIWSRLSFLIWMRK